MSDTAPTSETPANPDAEAGYGWVGAALLALLGAGGAWAGGLNWMWVAGISAAVGGATLFSGLGDGIAEWIGLGAKTAETRREGGTPTEAKPTTQTVSTPQQPKAEPTKEENPPASFKKAAPEALTNADAPMKDGLVSYQSVSESTLNKGKKAFLFYAVDTQGNVKYATFASQVDGVWEPLIGSDGKKLLLTGDLGDAKNPAAFKAAMEQKAAAMLPPERIKEAPREVESNTTQPPGNPPDYVDEQIASWAATARYVLGDPVGAMQHGLHATRCGVNEVRNRIKGLFVTPQDMPNPPTQEQNSQRIAQAAKTALTSLEALKENLENSKDTRKKVLEAAANAVTGMTGNPTGIGRTARDFTLGYLTPPTPPPPASPDAETSPSR